MAKGIVLAYLFVYNIVCSIGWICVLTICVKHVTQNSVDNLWGEVEMILKVVQTAAILEIVHAAIGLVKSSWYITFLQVFSRLWLLWAVLNVSRAAQVSWFVALTCASWGLAEVPRYLFYGLNLINMVPYPVLWLRYSLFLVMYPTGLIGELGCTYQLIQQLLGANSFFAMPVKGKLLLGMYILVAIAYVPGANKMYRHMSKSRASILQSGGKTESEGAARKSSRNKKE